MLPVVANPNRVAFEIVLYSYAMVASTLFLIPIQPMGVLYTATAVIGGLWFIFEAHLLQNKTKQAISNNPMRTLDAFWSGQIKSKEWLIERLENIFEITTNTNPLTIEIHGGWVGTLASLLFQSKLNIKSIRSVDIDPHVQHLAVEMNRIEYNQGRFESITSDMCYLQNYTADIVINTSCEHITQEQYDKWLQNTPISALIVAQGNNYDIPEHIRISKDIEDFELQCHLFHKYVGTLQLPMYNRYMIIGRK